MVTETRDDEAFVFTTVILVSIQHYITTVYNKDIGITVCAHFAFLE